MKRRISPRSEFKRELWNTLEKGWQAEHLPAYTWYQTRWFRWSAQFATIVGLFTGFGTGAYAYTSPEVADGTVLYPIKQQLESVEEKFKLTPQAKTQFQLKKLQRREAERKFLEARNKKLERTEAQIEKTEEQLEKLEKKLDREQDSVLIERVRERLENRKENQAEMENELKADAERMDKMSDEEFFSFIEREADEAVYREDLSQLDEEQRALEKEIVSEISIP